MSTTGVSFKIGTDNTEAKQAIKEFRDEFKTLRNELKTAVTDIKIKVSADGTDIFNEIKSELKEFRKLFSKEKVSISVTADMSDVTSELKQINQHIQQTNRQLDSIGNHATNAGNVAASGLSPLAASIKQVIAGYATLATAQLFIGVTDEAKKLEGQLKLVTKSEQELIIVRQMLLDQSNKTGTQMSSSVELYTKMYNATRNLNGASNALLVRVTDITNKFVAIGGSSGESANAALIQFAQAMAAGTLRGEELGSVLEQTPGLAKGLADGLGVSIGQLRAMAADGKLTTDVVINALLKMGKVADEQFLKMPRQAAQATTAIKNDFKSMVAELDKQWGFSESFVNSLEWLRLHLPEIKQLILDVVEAAKIAGAALLVAFGAPALIQAIGLLRVLIAALRLQLFALSVQAGVTGGWMALIAALRGAQAATLSLKSAFGIFAAALIGYEFGKFLRNEFEIVEIAGNKLGQWLAKFVVQFKKSWSEIKFHIDHFSILPKSDAQLKKEQQEFFALLKNNQAAYDALDEDLPLQREQKNNAQDSSKNTNVDNGKVSNKPVKPEIDKNKERLIELNDLIEREADYTAKKRAAIIEAGNVELKILESKRKTVQTDAKALGDLELEIKEKGLENARKLADFDKQRADEAKKNASELTQAKYEQEKKLIEQQVKDNDQLYKDEAINFLTYFNTKNDLNQKLYKLETGYLAQVAAKSKQHERELLKIKLSNVGEDKLNREKAIQGELSVFAEKVKKQQEAVSDDIKKYDKEIALIDASKTISEIDKINNSFEDSFKKIEELKKTLGDSEISIDLPLPNGQYYEFNSATSPSSIKKLEDDLKQRQIELVAKVTLKNKPDDIKKDVDKILSDKSYRDKYADIQANMNPMQRQDIEEKKRLDTLETIPKLKAELEKLYALQKQMQEAKFNTDSLESINKQIQDLNINIKELEVSAPTMWQEFRNNLIDTGVTAAQSGLADYFMDIMEGTKTANQALKDLARTFISSIAQMAAQASAKLAIFAALNAMTGGAAGAGVGFGGTILKAMGFQLHSGGKKENAKKREIKDIKSNEFVAILEDTEEVLTKNDPRHIDNFNMNDHLAKLMPRTTGTLDALMQPDSNLMQMINNVDVRPTVEPNSRGGGNGVNVKVINVMTAEQAAEHMASSKGEEIHLNHIQNNIAKIKQMLADD